MTTRTKRLRRATRYVEHVNVFGLRIVCMARTPVSARTWAQYVREACAIPAVHMLRNGAGSNAAARYAMELASARRPKSIRQGERLVLDSKIPDLGDESLPPVSVLDTPYPDFGHFRAALGLVAV